MKKSPIIFIILTLALTILMVSIPLYAVTNTVVLQIDGMT